MSLRREIPRPVRPDVRRIIRCDVYLSVRRVRSEYQDENGHPFTMRTSQIVRIVMEIEPLRNDVSDHH